MKNILLIGLLLLIAGCSHVTEEQELLTEHDPIKRISKTINHVTVYVDDRVRDDLIESAFEAVKRAEKENDRYLSETNTPLTIYVTDLEPSDAEFSMNPRIYIRALEDPDSLFFFETIEEALQNNIAYEYSRVILSQELKKVGLHTDTIPTWFLEGYGEWIGNQIGNLSSPLYTTYEEPLKPYHTLDAGWLINEGDRIQALIAVDEMFNVGKEDTLQTIFKELKRDETFNSILVSSFRIDIDSDEFSLFVQKKMENFYTREGTLNEN